MATSPVCAVGVALVLAATLQASDEGSFSSLPRTDQYRLRSSAAPPPPAEREGPYSTPMYYLMYEGYAYEGGLDVGPAGRTYVRDRQGPDHGSWKLDRNRPDWQEAMVRDWAELGLNNTHLNIYPEDSSLEISVPLRQAVSDYVELSGRYGLKIGVRLDAPGEYEGWPINPDNPANVIDRYLEYVRQVASLLKGRTVYWVLGDEMTLHKAAPGLDPRKWTPQKYLEYFKRVSTAIKSVDPAAKVSMFAASSGEWFNVLYLLEQGYARYGDAVAINYYNYADVPRFFDDARRLAPGLLFLSNGVGYVSLGTISSRYPEGDGYAPCKTETEHAETIAKNMFAWWDLGAATAPYYICLRNWVVKGRVYPRWFGFFGFQDFVIDENDQMTVKRYPGWYAFATIAHVFYNRRDFKAPGFKVTCSGEPTMFRAYEHSLPSGGELLVVAWNDKGSQAHVITLESTAYGCPVRVNLLNHHVWTDVPFEAENGRLTMKVQVGSAPVILRLFRRR